MKPTKKPCLKMECLIANGERVYYQREFDELKTKYAQLEQDFIDFKSFAYDVVKILRGQN
jgi:hypothetical protein